jgi:Mlc titration factor MtfA (ptsG expression regulator)
MILQQITGWWRQRLNRGSSVPAAAWRRCVESHPLLRDLPDTEASRLAGLTARFLTRKVFTGASGVAMTDELRLEIAAQACLLILNLKPHYFSGWHEIIVYPDSFIVDHEERDAAGVVHGKRRVLSGEAWLAGPVILSLADICDDRHHWYRGSNVILHEFAHKLDMRNGAANGMPPLHRGMRRTDWTNTFSQAYERLRQQLAQGLWTPVDPYAAQSPAEFFAVMTEHFFHIPRQLRDWDPQIYLQLAAFYRQDPGQRREA